MSEIQTNHQPLIESFAKSNFLIIFNKIDKTMHDLTDIIQITIRSMKYTYFIIFLDIPCIAKFTDNIWYRCIITNSEKILNTQYMKISLYYVDFGNHEYIQLHITDIHSK